MATIMDSLSKGITTLNIKKNNFIEETKCRTYISTLEKEINSLKMSLATKAYEDYIAGIFNAEQLNEVFETIKGKYEEIERQKLHIAELIETEKQILGTNNNGYPNNGYTNNGYPSNEMQNNAGENEVVVFCTKCGTPNSPDHTYCVNCGNQLND